MPPAAISRSSTYFPKICGNIATRHRSAFRALLLGLGPLFAGCAPLEPEVQTLEIRAHSLDGSTRCKIETEPAEPSDPAPPAVTLTLRALGPFPVSDLGAEVLQYDTPSQTLTFPDDTRGLEAHANDSNQYWHGYTDRRNEDRIDVLLWKQAQQGGAIDCDLFREETEIEGYPGPHGGQALGYSPDAGIVLSAGGDDIDAAGESFVFDANTGRRIPIVSGFAFYGARAYATVTPFGSGLLLAGGEFPDDLVPVSEREALQSAAFYDPSLQGFDGDPIALDIRRTRHAAVVLETGETLLVGGGQPMTNGETVAVAKFEVVSPVTRRSTIGGVDTLAEGRLEPSALRLDNGNILVGGGVNATGAPVEAVEWFSSDGSRHVSPSGTPCGVMPDPPCAVLEARHHRTFVALPGGGALTVGGCAPGEQDAACEQVCGKGFGCPASEPSATWIAPNGELTTVGFEQPTSFCAGTPPFSPERVMLAPGSDGSPWLFASDENRDYPCDAVFRFQPWSNVRACPSADETGMPSRCPVFVPVERGVTDWPDMRTRIASLGPDAFVWIAEGDSPSFVGARTGVRGALSQNETLLVTDSSAPEVPLHLAPDRWPNIEPRALFETRDGGRLLLDASTDGAPVVSVYVTDARYEDVTLTVGFDGNGPPLVLLGSDEIGGESCPWPGLPQTPLVVTRRDATVTLTDGAGNDARCETAPNGSVSIGFRAGRRNTTITSIDLKRD